MTDELKAAVERMRNRWVATSRIVLPDGTLNMDYVSDLSIITDAFLAQQFTCKARVSADPPQDCNWPFCGCDPQADKVLEAIEESGLELVKPRLDDTMLVTREWLGLKADQDNRRFGGPYVPMTGLDKPSILVYLGISTMPNDKGRWCAVPNRCPFADSIPVPTRGHLRHLALAMEIDLGELA